MRSQDGPALRLAEIRDAQIQVRSHDSSMPTATVRARRVREEHQKRGFFKIGALPLVAIEELSIEILTTNALHEAFSDLPVKLRGERVSQLCEARGLELKFSHCPGAFVRATTARWDSPNSILLINGSLKRGAQIMGFKSGHLKLTPSATATMEFASANGLTRIRLPEFLEAKPTH